MSYGRETKKSLRFFISSHLCCVCFFFARASPSGLFYLQLSPDFPICGFPKINTSSLAPEKRKGENAKLTPEFYVRIGNFHTHIQKNTTFGGRRRWLERYTPVVRKHRDRKRPAITWNQLLCCAEIKTTLCSYISFYDDEKKETLSCFPERLW